MSKDKMKWFNFYVDIRFPIGLFLGAFVVLGNIAKLFSSNYYISINPFDIIFSVFVYSLEVITYIKMRKKEGYVLNNVLLIIETIVMANSSGSYVTKDVELAWISFIILCVIWLIPNLIYFYKRRNYFN